MDIKEYFNQKKVLYDLLLGFLENENEDKEEYEELIKHCESNYIQKSRCEFQILLRLILKISKHHHRNPIFLKKIEQLILQFSDQIKQTFSNTEIFNIFINDKLILLILFKNNIITINDRFLINIFRKKSNDTFDYSQFFFPEIKPQLEEEENEEDKNEEEEEEEEYKEEEDDEEEEDESQSIVKSITKNLLNFDSEIFVKFDEKRKIGENDSYLCHLIRNDSIIEFVQYVTRKSISLSKNVHTSLFETNPFLTKNEVTLIEYAAFYGSIQIFQNLRLNGVELREILWLCAIHSNNAELFHLIEENLPKPDSKLIDQLLSESIKCHHNDIANYIKDNYYTNENKFGKSLTAYCFRFYNYSMLPDEFIDDEFLFFYMCEFDYYSIVDFLLKTQKKININSTVPVQMKSNRFEYTYFIPDLNKEQQMPALYLAAKNNNQEILNLLLNQNGIEIKPGLFRYCSKLTKIKIPSFITRISHSAFYNCASLVEVTIPSSVIEIDDAAFSNCISLVSIVIPSSVTQIGDSVFESCSSLEEITIPSSVTKIGDYTFKCCSSLEKIALPPQVTEISKALFSECNGFTEFVIPSSIKKICEYAFYKTKYLEKIEIPDSVTEIQIGAFCNCKSITKVVLPSSVKRIENITFTNCRDLKSVFIPSSVTFIGMKAFDGCTSLTHIEIPSSVTEIDNCAFYGCISLTHIDVPSSVTKIGNSCFRNCFSLVEFEIPPLVYSISDYCFKGCESLTKMSIHSSVVSIGRDAFSDCVSLEEITIPSSVKSIKKGILKGCVKLKQATIPQFAELKVLGVLPHVNVIRCK